MTETAIPAFPARHGHVFLGEGHEANERRTWGVIALCGCMMLLEIVGGIMFGSIALVADGMHMSTHAGALLLAALAYNYARKHAVDDRFTFGTGKLGDLAGFSSAIVLAMIALLIGYEAVNRFVSPVPIHFAEAIPIASLGLAVNVASVWLLSGGHHHHRHGHQHGQEGHVHEEAHTIALSDGVLRLEIYEDGMSPRFRLRFEGGAPTRAVSLVTERPDGARQAFAMVEREGYLESADEIPEPHAFTTHVRLEDGEHAVIFEEHEHHAHGAADRDNQYPRSHHPCGGGCCGVVPRHCGPGARPPVWLAMDGPPCGHRRCLRHRQLVLRANPRHRRYPARHDPRPEGDARHSSSR